jgi:hypothetical protein
VGIPLYWDRFGSIGREQKGVRPSRNKTVWHPPDHVLLQALGLISSGENVFFLFITCFHKVVSIMVSEIQEYL